MVTVVSSKEKALAQEPITGKVTVGLPSRCVEYNLQTRDTTEIEHRVEVDLYRDGAMAFWGASGDVYLYPEQVCILRQLLDL